MKSIYKTRTALIKIVDELVFNLNGTRVSGLTVWSRVRFPLKSDSFSGNHCSHNCGDHTDIHSD